MNNTLSKFKVGDRTKFLDKFSNKFKIGSTLIIKCVYDIGESTEHYKVQSLTKDCKEFGLVAASDLDYLEDFTKMSYFKLVDYLIDSFYSTDFINDHTRKELSSILRRIKPHETSQSKTAFNSMCKQRMCYHIEFFINVHLTQRKRSHDIRKR